MVDAANSITGISYFPDFNNYSDLNLQKHRQADTVHKFGARCNILQIPLLKLMQKDSSHVFFFAERMLNANNTNQVLYVYSNYIFVTFETFTFLLFFAWCLVLRMSVTKQPLKFVIRN